MNRVLIFAATALFLALGAVEVAVRLRAPLAPPVFQPETRAPKSWSTLEVDDVVNSGAALIAVSNGRSLVRFSDNGTVAGEFRFREHGLPTGSLIHDDIHRRFYLPDPVNARVLIFNEDLTPFRVPSFPLPGLVEQIAIGDDGSAYALCAEPGRVVEIDPALLKIRREIDAPRNASRMLVVGRYLYVTVPATRQLLRIDRSFFAIDGACAFDDRPGEIASSAGGQTIFVGFHDAPLVVVVDGGRLTEVTRFLLPAPATSLAAAQNDTLWVALGASSAVVQLDSASGKIRSIKATGGYPHRLAVVGHLLFAVARNGGRLERFAWGETGRIE